MKRLLVLSIIALGALTSVAGADNLLVLKSEGRADAAVRGRVDAAIVKLARTGKDTVTQSEITFSEAAAMVGCRPEEASCRDAVITTLAVDELVIVKVEPKGSGYEITVRRAGKGGATHDASTVVAATAPDKVDALAPLFGGVAPPVLGPPPPPNTTEPPTTTTPPNTTEPPTVINPTITQPGTEPPTGTKPEEAHTTGTDALGHQTDKQPKNRKRLYIAGMATGGGMIFLGAILWGAASSVQGEIDSAPTRTKADLQHLQDLEGRGDSLAGWGNFLTVGGVILGGVSTYLYIRQRRSHKDTSTAVLAPAVFPHGGGLTLTFGGSR